MRIIYVKGKKGGQKLLQLSGRLFVCWSVCSKYCIKPKSGRKQVLFAYLRDYQVNSLFKERKKEGVNTRTQIDEMSRKFYDSTFSNDIVKVIFLEPAT